MRNELCCLPSALNSTEKNRSWDFASKSSDSFRARIHSHFRFLLCSSSSLFSALPPLFSFSSSSSLLLHLSSYQSSTPPLSPLISLPTCCRLSVWPACCPHFSFDASSYFYKKVRSSVCLSVCRLRTEILLYWSCLGPQGRKTKCLALMIVIAKWHVRLKQKE